MALEFRFSPLEVRAADGGEVEGVGHALRARGRYRRRNVHGRAWSPAPSGSIGRRHLEPDAPPRPSLSRAREAAVSPLSDSAERLMAPGGNPGPHGGDVRDHGGAADPCAGFSVEMEVTAEDWPSPNKRIIRAATLWNVGLVDRPAYDEATAAIAKRAKEACRVVPRLWPLAV